jgi:hypothetical protein
MNTPETAVARFTLTAPITVTPPLLADGERWAGIVTTEKGLHHVILLPVNMDQATWKKQMAAAKKAGGDLPSRQELALLFVMLPEEFEKDWCWSNTQHAAYSDYAWYQDFGYGRQHLSSISSKLRARAVRRVAI